MAKFKIYGIDNKTNQPRIVVYEEENPDDAHRVASLEGIAVESVVEICTDSAEDGMRDEGSARDVSPQDAVDEVYVSRQGKRLGPFKKVQFDSMVDSGMISPDDLFWTNGREHWESVGGLSNPAGGFQAMPPIPQSRRPTPALSEEHPGFWLRFAAHFIDSIIAYATAFIAGFMIGVFLAIGGETDEDILGFFGMIGGFIAGWLYYALMESSKAQATLGKMACGFIVTDMEGKRISFGKASGRYFGMILSALTFFIGFIMCTFTERKQCLHDIMAGCLMYKKNSGLEAK